MNEEKILVADPHDKEATYLGVLLGALGALATFGGIGIYIAHGVNTGQFHAPELFSQELGNLGSQLDQLRAAVTTLKS